MLQYLTYTFLLQLSMLLKITVNNTIYRPDYLYTLQVTDQQLTWSNSSLKIGTDPDSSGFNGLGMIGHSGN